MTKFFVFAVIAVLALGSLSTHAQDVTVGELKSKGAVVLKGEELKAFLSDTTLRYENEQFATQVNLKADGSLDGSARRRIGGSYTTTFTGDWKITPGNRWCASLRSKGAVVAAYCRDVLKLADTYYYSDVTKASSGDERQALVMTVSK